MRKRMERHTDVRGVVTRLVFSAPAASTVVAVLLFTGITPTSGAQARVGKGAVLYSVGTAEQYVNNADDRARGKGHNPFGNFHDASATATHGGGPYPGDEALFKFKLYTSSTLKSLIGSAVFTCLYDFNKDAFCDASYSLNDGTVFGAGTLDTTADSFAIPITGGTGKYLGLMGVIHASPGPSHSQRLAFAVG